jgi:quercetin dioxygenase-like cupin family protein
MSSVATATYVKSDQGQPMWVLGSLFDIKASGKDTGGALTVVEMTFAPEKTAAPPHRHDCGEAVYVLDGSIRYHIEQHTVDAGPGDFLFFPQGTLEWVENVTTTPARALVLYTSGKMSEFFAEVGDHAPSRTLPGPTAPQTDMNRMKDAARRYGLEVVE